MEKEFKLCYVEGNKAWFTDNFENQWGDDWDDKPYEDNAGYPYDNWSEIIEDNAVKMYRKYKKHPIELKELYFETDEWDDKRPCDMGIFSVKEINKGAVAWIYTDKFSIYAGCEIEEFKKTIKENNGKIYEEV